MFVGYNTNGLAHHDPIDAIELLAELGYQGVGLTIDQGLLHPYRENLTSEIERVGRALRRHGMRSVIETGARFLLNPRAKHEPTLVTGDGAERRRRVDFYRRAIDIASAIGSDCVSIWSGILRDDPANESLGWNRLAAALHETLAHATQRNLTLAFEPEPGMFIDTMDKFERLLALPGFERLKLTLDIGHLHCQGETPIATQIERWSDRLANVHIEDMRAGLHEHLMFGEGEIDFVPVVAALRSTGYDGGLYVELSRHSHAGPTAAQQAIEFLRNCGATND